MSETPFLDSFRDWDPPSAEELAAQIPGLAVKRLIARGGMAAVYLARQESLDRAVALKVLPPALGRIEGFKHRFESEAQVLARLRHPAVVTVFDFGLTESGSAFIVMELIDGMTLAAWGRGRSLAEKIPVALRIIEGVAYLHRQGVVHADLKPDNVIVEAAGQVRIIDFGLATQWRGGGETSAPGFGTPPYTAPEAYRANARPDPRSDIYSLGQTLCEFFGGDPIPSLPDLAAITAHTGHRDLAAVIEPMIRQRPEARSASLDDAIKCVRQIGIQSASAPLRRPPLGRAPIRRAVEPQMKSRDATWKVVASLVAVVLGGMAIRHWQGTPAANPAPLSSADVAATTPPEPPPVSSVEPDAVFGPSASLPSPYEPRSDEPSLAAPPPVNPVAANGPPASATAPPTPDPAPDHDDPKLKALNEKFIAALARERDRIQATDTATAGAMQAEIDRIGVEHAVSDTDPPDAPESLRRLRRIYQSEKSRLDASGTTSALDNPAPATPAGSKPPAPPGAATKAAITLYWQCDDGFTFLVNGEPAEFKAARDTRNPVTTVWQADLDVSEGDVLGFKLMNSGGSMDFAAVAKAQNRLLFATDGKWDTAEGEPTPTWWSGTDKRGRPPRKLNSKEYINEAVQEFCGFVDVPRGYVLACWGANPARSNIRRVITKFDVLTARGVNAR